MSQGAKKKKKSRHRGPKIKRMTRKGRMNNARSTKWVENYEGKDLVRGYANRYGVDRICAIHELRALGISIDASYEVQLRNSIRQLTEVRARAKAKRMEDEEMDPHPDSDDTFAYIAGYTSGGSPFGTTWEEIGERPLLRPRKRSSQLGSSTESLLPHSSTPTHSQGIAELQRLL